MKNLYLMRFCHGFALKSSRVSAFSASEDESLLPRVLEPRFVDGLMLLTNCPREISFMIAQSLGHAEPEIGCPQVSLKFNAREPGGCMDYRS